MGFARAEALATNGHRRCQRALAARARRIETVKSTGEKVSRARIATQIGGGPDRFRVVSRAEARKRATNARAPARIHSRKSGRERGRGRSSRIRMALVDRPSSFLKDTAARRRLYRTVHSPPSNARPLKTAR